MFAPRGRTDLVAPGLSAPAAPSSTSAAGAGESGSSQAASGGALPPSPSSPAPPGSAATPGASPTGGLILLHVLGAVAHPGLYELHAGDRVVDAVAAAGGFTPNADQTQQNLARPIADGEQLVIPEQGAAPPLGSAAAGTAGLTPGAGAGAAGAAAGSGSGAGSPGGGQPSALVNINTADQALLETLPQVGPALAQRIIAWRTTNGRFTQLDDLKNVTGIGDKTFAALQPLVTL
ncbi:hypothetical protein C5B96_07585 [Subtercola sp. Z020]|nr:hypothetical protein C5B96_07585 [Subtercola sp. Z020]